MVKSEEIPIFLRHDNIAAEHSTEIKLQFQSMYVPDTIQQKTLLKDYSAIWAHLNHLYNTNDVVQGKEYYTEDWFKEICSQYEAPIAGHITRKDSIHHLYVQNWSDDGLVCTAIDSNVVLLYQYPHKQVITKENLAIVLLFQGDHWRIDALTVLDQKTIN